MIGYDCRIDQGKGWFDYKDAYIYICRVIEDRFVFSIVIIVIHLYLDSPKVLFLWKLLDMPRCIHEDGIIFAWDITFFSLVYKELIKIIFHCIRGMTCSLFLQIQGWENIIVKNLLGIPYNINKDANIRWGDLGSKAPYIL